MNDDVLSRIEAKVDALLRIVSDAPRPAAVELAAPDMVGPGITTINSATIALLEPISARWKPSLTDQLLTKYGSHGRDPSDAPLGQPRRSPAGFPLVYGGPGAPRIVHNGQVFEDDAAVEDYERRAAETTANSIRRDNELKGTIYNGRFKASAISDEEAGFVYAYTRTQGGTGLAQRVYFAGAVFSGIHADISSLITRGERIFVESGRNAHEAVAAWPQSEVKAAVLAVS